MSQNTPKEILITEVTPFVGDFLNKKISKKDANNTFINQIRNKVFNNDENELQCIFSLKFYYEVIIQSFNKAQVLAGMAKLDEKA